MEPTLRLDSDGVVELLGLRDTIDSVFVDDAAVECVVTTEAGGEIENLEDPIGLAHVDGAVTRDETTYEAGNYRGYIPDTAALGALDYVILDFRADANGVKGRWLSRARVIRST
jgi:hypothetical protein